MLFSLCTPKWEVPFRHNRLGMVVVILTGAGSLLLQVIVTQTQTADTFVSAVFFVLPEGLESFCLILQPSDGLRRGVSTGTRRSRDAVHRARRVTQRTPGTSHPFGAGSFGLGGRRDF